MPKICYRCKKLKETSEFCKNSRMKDGLSQYCKECRRIQKKEYYLKYRDKILEKDRAYNRRKSEERIKKLKETVGNTIPYIDGEIWKPIKGLEDKYEISNIGRAKSISYAKRGIARLLTISYNCHGYKKVSLQVNNKSKNFLVHRLVAQTFIPNPDDKPFVNHIDGDKTNSRVENLEWVTPRENVNHYHRRLMNRPYHLKSGRKIGWQSKPVRCVETGEVFPSIASAARSIGVCDKAISQLLSKPANRHTTKGHHWELAD